MQILGLVSIGFALALICVALYGRLFMKKDIEAGDGERRLLEKLLECQQLWEAEAKNVRYGINALARSRAELCNLGHPLEARIVDAVAICDEAILALSTEDQSIIEDYSREGAQDGSGGGVLEKRVDRVAQ